MSSPGLKITNFHYSNITLPTGTLTEYPKWVHMKGYPDELARDPEHEAELLARPPRRSRDDLGEVKPEPEPGPEPARILAGANNDRDIWLQIAEERGIRVDKRWKTDRIRKTVERAFPDEVSDQ